MNSYLYKYGIVKSPDGKTTKLFESIFPDIFAIKYKNAEDYVTNCWQKYNDHGGGSNNVNGLIFEYILATLLIREEILPFYLQAKVVFVPNVDYDILIYTKEFGPIALSAKTSLRERYKQADLEAIALKYVHRKAKNYLITLDSKEGDRVRKKIMTGDVIGLDDVVIANTPAFSDFIQNLKKYHPSIAPTVAVISSDQIVTADKIAMEIP